MAGINFPNLVPASRSYEPGTFREELFTAQNGAVVRLRYGNQRQASKLSLTFENISDVNAALILANYEQVMGADNYAVFTAANAAAGASVDLVPYLTETNSALRWKYAGPPTVTSVKPGLSTVGCEFTGELQGT